MSGAMSIKGPRVSTAPMRVPQSPRRSIRVRVVDASASYLLSVSLLVARLRHMTVAKLSGIAETVLAPVATWVLFVAFAGQGVRNLVGWTWYGIITAASALAFFTLFALAGRRVTMRRLPWTIMAFTAICSLSIIWSAYTVETIAASAIMTMTTAVGVCLAIAFPLDQLMVLLLRALQLTLGLSLALELVVAIFIGHRIPPAYMLGWEYVPDSYYWVNALLFEGGPIQGIVANRNPLAFVALLTLIGVIVMCMSHRMSLGRTTWWIVLSVATLALTRSATVTMCAIAVMAVFAVALVLRAIPIERRRRAIRIALYAAAIGTVAVLAFHEPISEMLGREPDMSGRSYIWDRVLFLWEMRPLTGWGWIMYWAPWIPMFRYLVVRPDGTPTMQAHNAYIEALFQTGLIGFVALVIAVVWVTIHTVRAAARDIDGDLMILMPALLMTALVVQSFTESRLLSEGNWVLFTAIATWLTVRVSQPRLDDVTTGHGMRGKLPRQVRGSSSDDLTLAASVRY